MSNYALATQKYGKPQVDTYLEALTEWLWSAGSVPERQKKILLSGIPILQVLHPMPPLPKLLYRGISDIVKFPTANQNVYYTPEHSPWTSWSEDKENGVLFCRKGAPGVVLIAQGVKFKNQKIFLWPFDREDEIAKLTTDQYCWQREWGIYLVSDVKMDKWERCH